MSDPDERIRRSWDVNADVWTAAVRAGAIASRRAATDDAVVAAVLACGGTRALDVGCGEGWLSRRLAEEGHDVTGIDASAALIERARQRGGARFICMSYDELAVAPARAGTGYDVAVCNFSLLAAAIAPLLRALAVITKPGGRLVIQTVHPAALAPPPAGDGWQEESFGDLPGSWSAMPWYFRTPESWHHLLDGAGWRVERSAAPYHPVDGRPLSLLLAAGRASGTHGS
jgi:2-polyprenyl-3-methyl-5-hydroxy-6-metoxy-1,4-benzoquinol methylase